ncbi:MAG: DUF2950 domain-containing protein [Betaproteobacteria bacterium]|nr:DUF2950 domain-containing protein [Betaproteobacteria bacterium]MDH5287218.1 DUF2950 domain-containing protein [Betaproteobacteria bacterium]
MRTHDNQAPGAASFARAGGRLLTATLLAFALLAFSGGAAAQTQRSFATPDLAVEALLQAVQAQDAAALVAVLGPAREWLFTGDRVADRAMTKSFADAYKAKHRIAAEGDKATLLIGADDYPFAFPLVRTGSEWRFDTEAGKDTLLARRIGGNELAAIEVLRAIVDAQIEYASADRNGNGVLEYARKFESSPGKRDGLYWKAKAGEPESPLGPLLAHASAQGYTKAKQGPTPYHGYLFRLLDGQGKPGAPDAVDYVVRGRTIGGFAAVAYPAKYGNTGIMTFVVNHDGVVHQADLGPKTAAIAGKTKRMVLGPAWTRVDAKK